MLIITPIRFDCCFDCSTYANKHKVDLLIQEKLPSSAAWIHARDHMLLPVLRRMVLVSSGIMPMRWTDLDTTLPERASMWEEGNLTKRKIKLYFWQLCSMVRLTYEQYLKHDTQDDTFFGSFASNALSAMHLLSSNRDDKHPIIPLRSPDAMHVWFQIKLVKNEDPVHDVIYNTASRLRWNNECAMWKVIRVCFPSVRPLTPPTQLHTQTFAQYGALEYGLTLAQQLQQITHLAYDSETAQGTRRVEVLNAFGEKIQNEINRQTEMRLMLALAIKDTQSPLHILGVDILRMVGQWLWQPEILRWEDVMSAYIETIDG